MTHDRRQTRYDRDVGKYHLSLPRLLMTHDRRQARYDHDVGKYHLSLPRLLRIKREQTE